MKKRVLLLLIFLFPLILFAQETFEAGYLVKNNGDTLRGYIVSNPSQLKLQTLKFKLSSNSDVETYLPEDLQSYNISGYKSFYVQEISQNEGSGSSKVFLENLSSGIMKLYLFIDERDVEHFYLQKGDTTVELTNDKKRVVQNSKVYYQEDKKYLNVLNYYFNDCPSWDPRKGKAIKFTEYHLKKAVREYNTCIEPDFVFEEIQKPRTQLQGAIFIGLNKSSVAKFGTREPESIENFNGGFHLNFIPPSRKPRFSIQTGFAYTQKGSDLINPYRGDIVEYYFKYLDLDVMIKYTVPSGKIRPFLGYGGIYGFFLNKEEFNNTFINGFDYNEYGMSFEGGLNIPINNKRNGVTFSYRYELSWTPDSNPVTFVHKSHQLRLGFIIF